MSDLPSKPTRQWEYRNMQCRLYRLGDIVLIGYVRVADEWIEVFETDDVVGSDMESIVQIIEDEADEIVDAAIESVLEQDDSKSIYDELDPVDPNPGVDPNPRPDPGPHPLPNPYDPDPEYPRDPWKSPIWIRSWSDIVGEPYGDDNVVIHDRTA